MVHFNYKGSAIYILKYFIAYENMNICLIYQFQLITISPSSITIISNILTDSFLSVNIGNYGKLKTLVSH